MLKWTRDWKPGGVEHFPLEAELLRSNLVWKVSLLIICLSIDCLRELWGKLISPEEPSSGREVVIKKSIAWSIEREFVNLKTKGALALEGWISAILACCVNGGGDMRPSLVCGKKLFGKNILKGNMWRLCLLG